MNLLACLFVLWNAASGANDVSDRRSIHSVLVSNAPLRPTQTCEINYFKSRAWVCTASQSEFFGSVSDVVTMCSKKEVVRSDAWRVVALMADHHVWMCWADKYFIAGSMSGDYSSSRCGDLSVAEAILAACKQPAVVGLEDLLHQPDLERSLNRAFLPTCWLVPTKHAISTFVAPNFSRSSRSSAVTAFPLFKPSGVFGSTDFIAIHGLILSTTDNHNNEICYRTTIKNYKGKEAAV